MSSVYTTKPVAEDGYLEIHLSLSDGLTPLMKCRAVRNSDGSYTAIVRDFNSGILIDQSNIKFDDTEKALNHAVSSALEFLRACID
jgi:hypothetical protein